MVFIENFLFQLLFSVGVIIAFGFIIAELNKAWCRMLGPKGIGLMKATGFIGNPIHETGHAIFCLIFGHKIVEFKVNTMDDETGVMGYVSHSYNKKNLYHQIGNFFIGIGPIIFGSLVLMLLMLILTPSLFKDIFSSLNELDGLSFSVFDGETYSGMLTMFVSVFTAIFNVHNFTNWLWWIFIFLGMNIVTHLTLSTADVKNSVWGFVLLLILYLVVDLILYLISPSILIKLTSYIVKFSFYIISLLLIGVLILILLLVLTFIFGGFKFRRYS